MLRHICDSTVQWLFVGRRPCSAGEVLSELTYFFCSQKSMNLHATKTVLESLVTTLTLFASERKLLEFLNDFVVDVLAVVVGDASVWPDEFQQVTKRRTIAKWEASEPFPRHGFTKRQWTTVIGQLNA